MRESKREGKRTREREREREREKEGETEERRSGRVGLGLNSPALSRRAGVGDEGYVSRFPRLV